MGRTRGGGRRTTKWLTAGAGLPVGVSVRERGRLTGRDALPARGMRGVERAGARARRQAEDGPREEERGRERGGELRVLGRDSVQQGEERVFPFSFYFSNPISPFAPFSFEQNIL